MWRVSKDMDGHIEDYQKEMLVPFLKRELRETAEFISKIERGEYIELKTLKAFFNKKSCQERHILRTLLRDEPSLF